MYETVLCFLVKVHFSEQGLLTSSQCQTSIMNVVIMFVSIWNFSRLIFCIFMFLNSDRKYLGNCCLSAFSIPLVYFFYYIFQSWLSMFFLWYLLVTWWLRDVGRKWMEFQICSVWCNCTLTGLAPLCLSWPFHILLTTGNTRFGFSPLLSRNLWKN